MVTLGKGTCGGKGLILVDGDGWILGHGSCCDIGTFEASNGALGIAFVVFG